VEMALPAADGMEVAGPRCWPRLCGWADQPAEGLAGRTRRLRGQREEGRVGGVARGEAEGRRGSPRSGAAWAGEGGACRGGGGWGRRDNMLLVTQRRCEDAPGDARTRRPWRRWDAGKGGGDAGTPRAGGASAVEGGPAGPGREPRGKVRGEREREGRPPLRARLPAAGGLAAPDRPERGSRPCEMNGRGRESWKWICPLGKGG